MNETSRNRRLRLRAPNGETGTGTESRTGTDAAGPSLEGLAKSLTDSELDATGIDGVELVFEAIETPQAAVALLEGLAENRTDGEVRVRELVVELSQ